MWTSTCRPLCKPTVLGCTPCCLPSCLWKRVWWSCLFYRVIRCCSLWAPRLALAAVLGDQVNYTIGRHFGPKVFQWENSRWFNKQAFDQAHAFYERYGGITIVIARFMPFLRTFAPFVAGVAAMTRSKFTAFNVGGALPWVLGIATAGYFFGNFAWVKENLDKIIWALILVPGVIAIFGAWRAGRQARAAAAHSGCR